MRIEISLISWRSLGPTVSIDLLRSELIIWSLDHSCVHVSHVGSGWWLYWMNSSFSSHRWIFSGWFQQIPRPWNPNRWQQQLHEQLSSQNESTAFHAGEAEEFHQCWVSIPFDHMTCRMIALMAKTCGQRFFIFEKLFISRFAVRSPHNLWMRYRTDNWMYQWWH